MFKLEDNVYSVDYGYGVVEFIDETDKHLGVWFWDIKEMFWYSPGGMPPKGEKRTLYRMDELQEGEWLGE